VRGLHPGPPPAHPVGIWLGVGKPRGLALAGRLADGLVPSLFWATPDIVPGMHDRIDAAAAEAGRDPAEIRRVYNIGGTIADGPTRGLLDGSPEHWVETLTGFASELGFDTFIFWPGDDQLIQAERFAQEVVPRLRAAADHR
jgi:alkanesulfonate monooxygenase SsuD/methylene tetrahydromethanopterin reductase-like flavin-dependent oxidoreductase (luciferase family)